MAIPRFAWGIDVGNRALKAVRLVRSGDGVKVDDFEFIEHETILSQSGDNRESLIQTALAQFVQRHQTKGGVVSVGVSGQSSFARFIKLPPVEPKQIPNIVRFEAIQQIPFPLDDVEWSYQLFQQPDSPEVEVGIFAMRKELVNQHIKFFTDVDLNVQVVQTSPLAVYNAVAHDGRLDKGVGMIVDIGAENTDLIIADTKSIWMRSIPIGGNNFTETLVKAFKLPFAKAEDLKKNAATSKYARQIFQAMRPVFADLVAEIQRSVGFYASVHRDQRIRKVIALGGTFKLPGLAKYLQQNLQLDIERVEKEGLGGGAPADPKAAAVFQENVMSCVGAYGLALQALDRTVVTSSLLPTNIKKEKLWREKTKWFGAAAALFVAGALIPTARYFIDNKSFADNEQLRSHAQGVQSAASGMVSEWTSLAGSKAGDLKKIKNVASLGELAGLWPHLIADLNNALPKPQPQVADGLARRNKDALAAIPRAQRNLIVVDQMQSQYIPDVAPVVATGDMTPFFQNMAAATVGAPGAGAPTPGGEFDPATGAAPGGFPTTPPAGAAPAPTAGQAQGDAASLAPAGTRGFLVKIRVTSPNAEALDIVTNDVIKQLLAIRPNAQDKNKRFAVAKAQLLEGNKISQLPARKQQLLADYQAAMRSKLQADQNRAGGAFVPPGAMPAAGGEDMPGFGANPGFGGNPGFGPNAGGFGGGFGPPPGPGQDDANSDAYKDRITGESVLDDWELVIGVLVVIDPPAYAPPAPAEGQQQAAAP
jgi:type IV pilus assembly protein PilM